MNHHFQLLKNLYSSASGKYLKFKIRFDKAVQSGRFRNLTKRKQSSLISRLKKLYEKVKLLQAQLRIAGAGAAFSLTLSLSNSAHAQSSPGPFESNDPANPLPPPVEFFMPRPAPVDIDNDGDIDVFVGEQYGGIRFFRNNSEENTVQRLTEITGSENPLSGINVGYWASLSFANVDDDSDLDLLVGNHDGETFFFRNTGSATNPVFTAQTGVNNPFDGMLLCL